MPFKLRQRREICFGANLQAQDCGSEGSDELMQVNPTRTRANKRGERDEWLCYRKADRAREVI